MKTMDLKCTPSLLAAAVSGYPYYCVAANDYYQSRYERGLWMNHEIDPGKVISTLHSTYR